MSVASVRFHARRPSCVWPSALTGLPGYGRPVRGASRRECPVWVASPADRRHSAWRRAALSIAHGMARRGHQKPPWTRTPIRLVQSRAAQSRCASLSPLAAWFGAGTARRGWHPTRSACRLRTGTPTSRAQAQAFAWRRSVRRTTTRSRLCGTERLGRPLSRRTRSIGSAFSRARRTRACQPVGSQARRDAIKPVSGRRSRRNHQRRWAHCPVHQRHSVPA